MIVSPVELIKTRLQVQHDSVPSSVASMKNRKAQQQRTFYNGPIDCIVKIVKESGVKGLFKGKRSLLSRPLV